MRHYTYIRKDTQVLRIAFLVALVTGSAIGQNADPTYAMLERAYQSLRQNDYDRAIAAFEAAITVAPDRAAIRKDLAYTLLKIGENEAARDQFAEAMRIDPADQHVALEYAFLCYETKQQATARRIFDRIRKTGNATAEQAFQNIDQPLGEGIARWKKALELSPDNFSAHQELATLAEQRDELELAAANYQEAWRLRPQERSLMLDLGRVWKALGRNEEANAILLAASRGGQARVEEKARELLPARYPYAYEFEKALEVEPGNLELRREYAYLLLQIGKQADAEQQFFTLHQAAPDDLMTSAQLGFLRLKRGDRDGAMPLLEQVLKGNDAALAQRVREALKLPQSDQSNGTSTPQASKDAKTLGEKSMQAGYLRDALKYLTLAHDQDPGDFEVMLKLGWVNNLLHDDREAIQWFDQASQSPDPSIAKEADDAYKNLAPEFARFRTTVWMFPMFSTRWHDVFGYGQVKTEIKLGHLPIHPYLSTRFIGDVRGSVWSPQSSLPPQYLSESSFIFGVGVATSPIHGVTGWFEAGTAVKYLTTRNDVGAAIPDFRGGVSYAKGFGHLLNSSKGLFFETNADGVFVSRFQNDMILYVQNRAGYTFAEWEGLGGFQPQLYWNANGTTDSLRQYWANFVETGPGIRFRFRSLPKAMLFSLNFVRGAYTVNEYNPRQPNYYDFRVGIWYAFTR